jgi:hypothetical protein
MQFRLNLPSRGIRGGSHERIQYADVEAKKAANRNDEAEGAQTEIHRSFANEGAEPTGPRPCRFSEWFEMILRYAQYFAWPFVIALALALRLTKVTIDVFDWAK